MYEILLFGLPGNRIVVRLWPAEYNVSHSFFTCVVFPARSRPSMTINAPRLTGFAGCFHGYWFSEEAAIVDEKSDSLASSELAILLR